MPASTTIGKYTAVLFALDNDAVEYRDHQPRWAYESGAIFSPYDIQVTYCPAYFVPGHTNTMKYKIYPDAYTAPYAKQEIFRRDAEGNITGEAIYTSTSLYGEGGTEQSVIYSGKEIAYTPDFDPGRYIARISIGNSATDCVYDQKPFEVKAWSLKAIFLDSLTDSEKVNIDQIESEVDPDYVENWDELSFNVAGEVPPYCSGVDSSTVTSSGVAVSVWYWDEAESNAYMCNIDNGTATDDISDTDWINLWGQDIQAKPVYDEVGASIADINGVCYSMSETDQYFYIRFVIAEHGVLDHVDNLFDADPNTSQRENAVLFKLKLDSDGNLTIIDYIVDF